MFGPGPSSSGNTPVASVLTFGSATGGVCPNGSTFAATGCVGGHFRYLISISRADAEIGFLSLKVTTEFGPAYIGAGALGFTILNGSGAILAQAPVPGGELSMGATNTSWVYSNGAGNLTRLGSGDLVEVDVGSSTPSTSDLFLACVGDGVYSGTTPPVSLP